MELSQAKSKSDVETIKRTIGETYITDLTNINDEDVVVNNLIAVAKKDGTVTNPKVTMKYGKLTLKEGTDYKLDWSAVQFDADNKVIPGTYEVVATAVEKSNYTGTTTIDYTIVANTDEAVSKASVKVTEKVSYEDFVNGKRPAVKVTYKKVDLIADSKVDIEWPEEIAVGKKNVVTIVAKDGSGFYGTKTAKFELTGVKLTADKFEVSGIADAVYTGEAIEQSELVVNDKRAEAPVALVEGEDYEVAYAKNINVGTATVTVKGINAFTGTLKKTFKIAAIDASAEGAVVKVNIPKQTYTGKKLTPAAEITVNGVALTKKDFTAKYSDNTKAGTAKVV